MRRAQIVNLAGRFGMIQATGIWDLVNTYGLDGLFLDARVATMADLDYIRSKGKTPGLIVVPSWLNLNGADAASWMNQKITDLGFVGARAKDPCDIVFDNETHDPVDIAAMIRRWRQLRYLRQTYWAPEPLQAGWFSNDLIQTVNSDINLCVVAQSYRALMQPVAADAVRDNLTRGGIDDTRAKVYYPSYTRHADGGSSSLPPLEAMDGILFDLDHA